MLENLVQDRDDAPVGSARYGSPELKRQCMEHRLRSCGRSYGGGGGGGGGLGEKRGAW